MTSIDDAEIVCRHIPGGTTFQAPGPRITSKNFALRHDRNETGISVSRTSLTSPAALMDRVGDRQFGSRVALASVGEIRELGLDVISDPIPDDPGHALIVGRGVSLDTQSVRKQLAMLFRYIELLSDNDN